MQRSRGRASKASGFGRQKNCSRSSRRRSPMADLAAVLTVKQVAGEFFVKPKTVYGWINHKEPDKRLHAIRLPGGDYRVRREDIAEFEGRCRDPNTPNLPTD